MKSKLPLLLISILFISFTSASLSLYPRDLSLANLNAEVNITVSLNTSCTDIIFSEDKIVSFDASGVSYFSLNTSFINSISDSNIFLCYYLDGIFVNYYNFSDILFNSVTTNRLRVHGLANYSGTIYINNNTDIRLFNDTALINYTNVTTTNWIQNTFLLITSFFSPKTSGNYLYNDSNTFYFNETFLNGTIDLRASSFGGNASWNETHARTIFALIGSGGNTSWNQSFANGLYAPNTTAGIQYLINGTGIYNQGGGNATFNESYTNKIYAFNLTASIQYLLNWTGIYTYAYNQTIPANLYTDDRITLINNTRNIQELLNSTGIYNQGINNLTASQIANLSISQTPIIMNNLTISQVANLSINQITNTTTQQFINLINNTRTAQQLLNGTNMNFGNVDFNNGWNSGGVSILGGSLFAQILYVYNLSSLNVNSILTNGSLLPSFDNLFDLGNSSFRWKNIFASGDIRVNGTLYYGNAGIPVTALNETALINSVNTTTNIMNLDFYNKSEINEILPSALTYYFWDTNSTVNATYKVMNTTQNPTATTHNATNLIDGDVIVWRLNQNTNLTSLSSGQLHLHTTVNKTAGTQNLQIYGQLFRMFPDKSLELLGTTNPCTTLVTAVSTPIQLFAYINQTTMNVNDMLLWRLVASVSGGGTAPSVTVIVGGTTNNELDLPVSISSLVESDPQSVHVDGTRALTGNWQVGGYNITNISHLQVANSANISGMLYVNISNVGIGTTNPQTLLDVQGTLRINGSNTPSTGAGLEISYGRVANTADLLSYDRTGSAYKGMYFSASNFNWTLNGAANSQMVLTTGGNVGIGTASPNSLLDVRGNIYVGDTGGTNSKIISNVGDTTPASIEFRNPTTRGITITPANLGGTQYNTIFSAGNVGIGTTSPETKLHIKDGDIRIEPSSGNKQGLIIGNHSTAISQNLGQEGLQIDYNLLTRNVTFSNAYWGGSFEPFVFKGKTFDFQTGTGAVVQRFYIDATGNVGIGTTSPQDKLEVNGNISLKGKTNETLRFYSADNNNFAVIRNSGASLAPLEFVTGGGNGMILDNTGKVGIGTTNPQTLLDVQGTLRINGSNTPSTGAGLEISYGRVANTADLLSYDRTGSAYKGMYFSASNFNWTLNGAANSQMVLTTGGNVGIGTTSPQELLQIGTESSGPAARKAIKIGSGGYGSPSAYQVASNGDKLILYNPSSGDSYDGRIGVGSTGDMWFKSSGVTDANGMFRWFTGSTPNERMTLLANGNLGIGTTTPSRTLEVAGIGNFSGVIYYNNVTKVNSTFFVSMNNTNAIGLLYNYTASMIANLSINQLNWTYSLIANNSFNQNVLTYNNSLFNFAPWNVSGTSVYLNNPNNNVGIRTISPTATLDLGRDTSVNTAGLAFNVTGYSGGAFYIKETVNNNLDLQFDGYFGGVVIPTLYASGINGYVGIGTTLPNETLYVQGNATISEVLKLTQRVGALPTCSAVYNRSFMANNSGVYICGNTGATWTKV